jgi:hypothetical protein
MAVKDDFYINGKIVAETGLRSKNLVSASVLGTDADGNLIEAVGATGSFTTTDGKTVTVTDGLITSIA